MSELQLTPSILTIRLGEMATFDAIHPYIGVGSWTYDPTIEVLEETSKLIHLKPIALGSYAITYSINEYQGQSILYVVPTTPSIQWSEPIEPTPPPKLNVPPDKISTSPLAMDLADSSFSLLPLYKYPTSMKRNARYRGHRESEKVLNDHQEQIFDIRQLYQDISSLDTMKDITIDSWFNGIETVSISMESKEYTKDSSESLSQSVDSPVDSIRILTSDMIQLSGNSLEESTVGIYEIKRQMQQLDERIAEAERRYRDYENAYE